MDIKEITYEYLRENEFDGLFCDECGCKLDDLMPCSEPSPRCEPGYIQDCSKCEYYDFESLSCEEESRECIGPKEMMK